MRTPDFILRKMADTINASDPGYATKGTFTPNSCYGKVAHYLRKNQPKDGFILLFGDEHNVSHACIYDNHGRRLVDSFPGHPVESDGKVFYDDGEHPITDYPAIRIIRVSQFFEKFVKTLKT